jgi:hypothetical protein
MNMAVGMGAGIAVGIGAGMASGQKTAVDRVEKNLRELAATHRVTVEKPEGGEVPFEDFLRMALDQRASKKAKFALIAGVGLGVLFLALLALFFFLR